MEFTIRERGAGIKEFYRIRKDVAKMNYEYITSKEGYRIEDLSENDRMMIYVLNSLVERIEEEYIHQYDSGCEEGSMLDTLKREIAKDAMQQAAILAHLDVLDLQISMADSHGSGNVYNDFIRHGD